MDAGRSQLSPQPWPWPGPRVLVEHHDEEAAAELIAALRRDGFAVALCTGPEHDSRCPLAADDGCVAAAGADVVVSWLGLETPEARETLAALRLRLAGTPLLVVAGRGEAARWPELVRGATVVDAPATPEQVVGRVRALRTEEPAHA
jgi:DNA-binding response OmpR family regulator